MTECECVRCRTEREHRERWDRSAIGAIQRVLECHVLGAEVIALKDPKSERLNALRALDRLHYLEQRLDEATGRATPTEEEA